MYDCEQLFIIGIYMYMALIILQQKFMYVFRLYVYMYMYVIADGQQTANCDTQPFLAPAPACPGDQLNFSCAVYDTSESLDTRNPLGRTVWTGTYSPVSDLCILNHDEWPNESLRCEPLDAQAFNETPTDCFISTLNGTAVESLNETEVICSIYTGTTIDEINRTTIIIIG